MTHNRFDYASLWHERGFRVTPQRQLILDAVCQGAGHTTLPEIYARVQQMAPAINLATVYRTLDFLNEMGLVVSGDMGDGRMVYEIAGQEPHHHLVCRRCGASEQISHATVQALFDAIAGEQNFHIEMDHLVLFGTCQACHSASPHQTPASAVGSP